MKEQAHNTSPSQFLKTGGGKTKSNAIEIPSISLPKGGGAIKGIDEKFAVNAVNGTSSFSIPLPFAKARAALPALSLSYNSGNGNGVFGLGWSMALGSVKRKTDNCLPQYIDSIDSDTFIFSDTEDLVAEFAKDADGNFLMDAQSDYIFHEQNSSDNLFTIRFYKPSIEGLFARIERWQEKSTKRIKWRIITRDNVSTLFGWTNNAIIANPSEPEKIVEWLPEFIADDKGNCVHYIYKAEDAIGFDDSAVHNKNRFKNGAITYTNRYLEKILYGNTVAYKQFGDSFPAETAYLFQTVFDYGTQPLNDAPDSINAWDARPDAFSNYKAGFEIRTTRLCKRVLLFHVFDELAVKPDKSDKKTLVKSINFKYDTGTEQDFTFLTAITSYGYIKKTDGTYTSKNFPPMEFIYQRHEWNKEVKPIAPEALVHAPVGLDETHYQFTDLYNEGLCGILSENGNGWYYKRNLGDGNFEQAKLVSPKPSFSGSHIHLTDLDADGGKQFSTYSSATPGYFELTDEGEWQGIRYFKALPNINFSDPNTRMLDLNGDGKPEVMISGDQVFTWYPSEGRLGFAAARKSTKSIDEEESPHVVFADEQQTIYLADMSGDGMTDLVRIRNGSVCYWPNMGYGKFGAKVTIDQAPVFDHPDAFQPSYIRLADIDGSGTTDIIYLGKTKFTCWKNLSGNRFSEVPFEIELLPAIHSHSKISVVDLLGNGVACIVWSSSLAKDATAPMKYIDLMNSKKPHVLISYKNNMGKEVSLEYTPSTKFYLEDKLAGKPWMTNLHFPVHCVSKTITKDKISGTELVSGYKYHHGYYDHPEKEFRGFGMVEQTDAETAEHWIRQGVSSIAEEPLNQEPVVSKTWFHTGAFLQKYKILNQFAADYWYEEMKRRGFPVSHPEVPLLDAALIVAPAIDPDILEHLSAVEWREAARACKSMKLRVETFAYDAAAAGNTKEAMEKELTPFAVVSSNCVIELLQPKGKNKHAVYLVKESENRTYNYERKSTDPRIVHSLNIKFDEVGNVLESAAVVYPRVLTDALLPVETQQEQNKTIIIYKQNQFTNDVIADHIYRLRLTSEVKTLELKGVVKTGTYFSVKDFAGVLTDEKSDTAFYHELDKPLIIGKAQKRVIEQQRSIYYRNNLTAALPLHQLESLALPFESYQLAYTPELVADIFGSRVNAGILTEGKYMHSEGDNNWWIRSGIAQFKLNTEVQGDAQNRFYVPVSYTDPYGAVTTVNYYGTSFLLIEATTDTIGNTSTVLNFNFRSLSPQQMRDINANISEVMSDELGLIKALALKGKGNEADELTGLNEFTDGAETLAVQHFFQAADSIQLMQAGKNLLNRATSRYVYDFETITTTGKPAVIATISREKHFQQNADSPIQIGFEYSNGLGEVVMKKKQAEPGKAKQVIVNVDGTVTMNELDTTLLIPKQIRWIGNGRTIKNNKGNVVKQYEPYFSVTWNFENNKELVETGVTPKMYYDAVGRLIRTEMPDETFTKITVDAWKQQVYDANDTLLEPECKWFQNRTNRLIDATLLAEGKDPGREKIAADQAAKHANTPSQFHFDSLGRSVLWIEHNKNIITGSDELYPTKIKLDAEGNLRSVSDARNNLVMLHKYDMLGKVVYQNSMDSGQRWLLTNILGNALRTWDERNHEFQYTYDALHRPVQSKVLGGDGPVELNHVFDRLIYGETFLLPGRSNEAALQAQNKLGKIIQHYDTGGVVETPVFDFKDQPLSTTRKLFRKYKEVANWIDANLLNDLEPGAGFTFINNTDALGRITQQTSPDGSIITPLYNEAGLLDEEHVLHPGNTIPTTYIKNIDYNERGHRSKIVYGNDVSTNFYYDKKNFRIIRLESKRLNGDPLQDWYYTYDAVGNISHVEDKNIPVVFFDNQKITGVSTYTYDALYRLSEATGRENNAALDFGTCDNWNDASFLHAMNGGSAMLSRNYTQRYQYDHVGNIIEMKHLAAGGNWTRGYEYETSNNRLTHTAIGDNSNPANYTKYQHHAKHGYLEELPHLEKISWNFKEQVVLTSRQHCTVDNVPVITYYQYDGSGQRLRKLTENQAAAGGVPTVKDERIYISGYERYKKYTGTNAGLERISLSLMDQGERFVIIETRNEVNDGTTKQLARYQLHNYLGSAALELDGTTNAAVISYEEYHPFGTTAYQANNAAIQAAAKRYRYTSMERDEETGLEYHSARYYLPWLGRWLSCDPIGLDDGINVYAYCKGNPIKLRDQSGYQSADQLRFREIFNERRAANSSTAHAQTLIRAFTDTGISGSTARDRLEAILRATGGNPNAPSANFDTYTIRAIGTDTGGTGDTGFRRELRDSIHYHRDASGNDIALHRLSSDQIGHFLTAVNFGYALRSRDNYIRDRRAEERAYRQQHPYLSIIQDALSPTTDMAVQYAFERAQYMRAMVGHELIADRAFSGIGITSTIGSVFMPSDTDIHNFEIGRLDLITLDDSQRGNSYQDLLMTWVGYTFGEHIANGTFSSNAEAARWLEMMLTDTNLATVAPSDPFYSDAMTMQYMLTQFRTIQHTIHP